MSFIPKNVRTRLTLWFAVVISAILLVYSALLISLVYVNLRNNLDDRLQQDYEIVEDIITVVSGDSVKIDYDEDPYFYERWFQLWSIKWKLIYDNKPFTSKSLPPITKSEKKSEGFNFEDFKLKNGVRVRILSGKINLEGKWFFIRLIRNEDRIFEELYGYLRLMLIALPIAVLIAAFGGFFLTGKLLSPIDKMVSKAGKISEENLKERLPVVNPEDELGNLALVFNEMLNRLEKSFERLKQFTSDAAHELRTPLTAIRSIGEVALQNHKDAKYYREIIGSILEENNRLTHLVDNLLFLSRADAKRISKNFTPVNLNSFVRETVEFIQPLAEEKNQTVIIESSEVISVKADSALLKQALLNLLDNAIKYSPNDSQITVSVKTENGSAIIEVKDNGPGISAEHIEKIFERFYRIDKGRSRKMGGSGLGLAIASWAIKSQGGKLIVESEVGKGSIFKIILRSV